MTIQEHEREDMALVHTSSNFVWEVKSVQHKSPLRNRHSYDESGSRRIPELSQETHDLSRDPGGKHKGLVINRNMNIGVC